MYQITREIHEFKIYDISKEDIEKVKAEGEFEWDVDNMTEENFQELFDNVESDYLEYICKIETETIEDKITTVVNIEETIEEEIDYSNSCLKCHRDYRDCTCEHNK